jgi:hypothetical protein
MSAAPTRIPGHQPRHHPPRAPTAFAGLALGVILAALLVGLHVFGASTVVGSGVTATESRSLPPFHTVDVTGASSLDVATGAPQSVVVRADGNLLSRITTRVASGHLVIGNRPGRYSFRTPVRVRVTVPSVTALALSGSGDITVSGIHNAVLDLSLAGLGTIQASGTTARLHVDISGAGAAELGQLVARDVTADVSGEGQMQLTATRSLRATVSGNATIRYHGDPSRVVTHVSGIADISRR